MCLSNFIEFKTLEEKDALTGYRIWKSPISNPKILKSLNQEYIWTPDQRDAKVTEKDSGYYAYNYNNNNNNYNNNYYNNSNNNYYYNYYYYYNNYNYNNYYYYQGITKHWGKTAIHSIGIRSEKVKIIILFTIKPEDAKGPREFLDWIKEFNSNISEIAKAFGAITEHYQDFIERIKNAES